MTATCAVRVTSDAVDLGAAVAAARAFASGRGATEAESDQAAGVVRELVSWVSRTCFPPPSTGHIEACFAATGDGLLLTLRDDGVPLPSFGIGLGPIPDELAHLAASTIDLHMVNQGAYGKTVMCLVPTAHALSADGDPAAGLEGAPRAGSDSSSVVGSAGMEMASRDVSVESRIAQPGDAEAVGRVIHAVYGLGYGRPAFYEPAELRAAWASGDVVSAVALVDGEIVAHAALVREHGGDVYEAAAAAVDPRFQGLGLTRALAAAASTEAFGRGAFAISSRMVTTHTRSQSGPAKAGFVPTGLLLGAFPPARPGEPRQTLLVAYLVLQRPPRPVALPSQESYRQGLLALYGRLRLEVVEQDVTHALAQIGDAPGVEARFTVGDETPAVVVIRRWGQDEHDALVNALRDAVTARPSMIYVDLDLHTLTTGQLDEIREFLSWYDFLAGGLLLFAEFGHDHLRLQVMLSTDLQIDRILLHTDEARELRAMVFNDHALLAQRLEEAPREGMAAVSLRTDS